MLCVTHYFAGICVSEPLEVIVRKDFFIDLRLPYAAVRGEQIEVKAILHNLDVEEITVSLADSSSFMLANILSRYFCDIEHQIRGIKLHLITKVRVDLLSQENICSSASKRKRYRQEISVAGQSTRSVPFVIIPMKHGEFPIAVEAAVRDSVLKDGVEKLLRVVVRKKQHTVGK